MAANEHFTGPVLICLPVKMQVKLKPIGRPNMAPASKLRNTDPGIANVCLNRYAEPNRNSTRKL